MEGSSVLDVAVNLEPLMLVHHDGRIERLKGTEFVPPSVDSATGVSSKDVVIDSTTGVSVRIYLPPAAGSSAERLPILVYFHGGAFCVYSATSSLYHHYVNSIAAAACAVCVSVDYRLAPEHPLPAAYEDSWAALSWVVSHASRVTAEPWLANHGDFSRFFLAGDSAGANLAHDMAMRAGLEPDFLRSGVQIDGIVAIHPFFWFGPSNGPNALINSWIDRLWRVVYPSSARALQEPCINPSAAGAPTLAGLSCRRVLVCLAELDYIKEQGEGYLEALQKSGFAGALELLLSTGEEHVFQLLKTDCEKAEELMKRIVAFLRGSPQSSCP